VSVVVGFVDEYAPDVAGVHAASAALASGGRVEVNWPARTQSLLVRKVPGWDHSAIDADEVAQSRGGSYAEAVRFARSAARLSRLSEFLEYLGASDERHAHALSVYLRLGNLAIIRSLYSTLLQSEGILLKKSTLHAFSPHGHGTTRISGWLRWAYGNQSTLSMSTVRAFNRVLTSLPPHRW
jgi:hypothetical protein